MTIDVVVRFVEPPSQRSSLPTVWLDRPVRNAPATLVLAGCFLALVLLPNDREPLGAPTRWMALGSAPRGFDCTTLHNTPGSLFHADRPEL